MEIVCIKKFYCAEWSGFFQIIPTQLQEIWTKEKLRLQFNYLFKMFGIIYLENSWLSFWYRLSFTCAVLFLKPEKFLLYFRINEIARKFAGKKLIFFSYLVIYRMIELRERYIFAHCLKKNLPIIEVFPHIKSSFYSWLILYFPLCFKC